MLTQVGLLLFSSRLAERFSDRRGEMMDLTFHALRRQQQRGITSERLRALLANADIDRPAGRNCRLLRISRKNARTIRDGDKLSGLAAVVSDDTGVIVTVLHVCTGHRGRWYRRAA